MKGDIRCVEGRLMRHDPQFDDPELETDIGECPECEGNGHNCADCGASHAEETWDSYARSGAGFRRVDEHFCTRCADHRRDQWLEHHS